MTDITLHPIEFIASKIIVIRGQKVMIANDLAELYGVTTKRLNEQVKRNIERFPEDFVFQLSEKEKQEVVANCDHLNNLKFSKALPYAFTEHGAIQAANVLNSSQAAEVSVYVVRAFIRLRELLSTNKELLHKFKELELRIERKLEDHDQTITGILRTIHQLMIPEDSKKRPIGFVHPEEELEDD
ncbi:MAG: ORF6N domain-containing protein [Gammaproteobacteria bacterium]|nr:MAG: ORF6N domain-containing protein [Gammaproteobacteria bacterium]